MDYGKCWRNNAGDGLFSNPQNWSDNTLPASGEDVTVIATSETLITSASDMTVGTVSVPFGVARFGGSGVITVGGVDVSFGASLATGGALRFSSLAIPSGAVVEITGVEGLADAGITGAGTLVINPGAGNTLTMTKNNTGFTGLAVIKSGTVKFGDRWCFGRRPAKIRVKGGATLDENDMGDDAYDGEKNIVTLEEGATVTTSGGTRTRNGVLTTLTLEGDATVDASGGWVALGQDWNWDYSHINLAAHTLMVTGNKKFYIMGCIIAGTGMIDVSNGVTVACSHRYYHDATTTCADGTIRIREGATWCLENYTGHLTHLSVKNLILDDAVTRDVNTYTLTVTDSISGSGTTQMLTMKPGAVFKPSGTGYLTITDSLSGVLKIDLSKPGLKNASKIPLVKVPSALASSVSFDNLPKSHELRIDEVDGTVEYWLKHTGFAIIMR